MIEPEIPERKLRIESGKEERNEKNKQNP